MKRAQLILFIVLALVTMGLLVSVPLGILSAKDLPFAFGVLAVFGGLMFVYTRVRIREE